MHVLHYEEDEKLVSGTRKVTLNVTSVKRWSVSQLSKAITVAPLPHPNLSLQVNFDILCQSSTHLK